MKKIFLLLLFIVPFALAQVDTVKVNGYSTGTSIKSALDKATNSMQLSGDQTATGNKTLSGNKAVFGTATNDSVRVTGRLQVNNLGIGSKYNSATGVGFMFNSSSMRQQNFVGSSLINHISNFDLDATGNDVVWGLTNSGGSGIFSFSLPSYSFGINSLNGSPIFIGVSNFLSLGLWHNQIVTEVDTFKFGSYASGTYVPENGIIKASTLNLVGNVQINGVPYSSGGSVGNADSLDNLPASAYVTKSGINGWSSNLYTTSANEMKLGKSYNTKRFNNGAYSDVWNIDYVIPPYNLSASWLFPIEHRTDYFNDTIQTVSGVANLLKIDGTGTPIWKSSNVVIGGNETNIRFGDLPDSVTLDTNSYAFGNEINVGEENKTGGATRFPMPFRMYSGKINTGTYTYPSFITYYSNLANVSADVKYHFYGQDNHPSYFGGNVLSDGYFIQNGDTVLTTQSGEQIIGSTATLDSIIAAFWAGTLGGGSSWDSTYAYQRITTLESQVTSLQNTVNNILAALDTCGCSASTADNTPTAPPTSLVAHGGEYETQMRVTWTDPTASDLDSIRIYRNTSNDSTGATWIASVAENIETYTNTGRTANTTYWYWAKALDDSSNLSYFSNSDSGKTLATAVADTGFYMLDAEDGVAMLTITGAGITASTDRGFGGSSHSYKVAGLGGVLRTYADFDFPVASQNQDTIWVTYRIYIPAGTAVADGGWNYAHLLIGAGDANGDNGEFGLNSATDIDGWQKPFGTLVSTNFSTGAWHKIEVMYIQGTGANARDYCYVDESLVYSTNTGAGTVDTDGFRFGAYNWTMATGEAIYFDNIIFSTARLPLD